MTCLLLVQPYPKLTEDPGRQPVGIYYSDMIWMLGKQKKDGSSHPAFCYCVFNKDPKNRRVVSHRGSALLITG